MSVLMAVRIPDELAAQVDAKGKRSSVIIAALRSYLGEIPQPKLKAQPGVTRESVTVPPVVVRETVSLVSVCPRCGGQTIPWGTSRRCQKCQTNY